MNKSRLLFIITLVLIACSSQPQYRDLFNGKDLTGWHVDVPELDNNPSMQSPFIVRDGMLVSLGTPGGHLITDDVSMLQHHARCTVCSPNPLKCR